MQYTQKPFRPLVLRAPQTAVSTSIQSVQINPNSMVGGMALRIANIGTNVTYISFTSGADAGLTTANGIALLPNTVECFFFADDMTHVNIIGTATGNTVSITFGEGS